MKYGFVELRRLLKRIASANRETPVTFPGKSTTGGVCDVPSDVVMSLVMFLMARTISSSFLWSESVDPPTRIMPAPALIAFSAVRAACFGLKSSGSIKAAQIGARFVLCSKYFSTAPGPLNSGPYARKVVYECVVYVDISPLGWVPELSPNSASQVATGNEEDRVL